MKKYHDITHKVKARALADKETQKTKMTMKTVCTTGRFEYVGPLKEGEPVGNIEDFKKMLDSFAGAIYRAVMKPAGFPNDTIKFVVEKVEVK